MGGMSDHPPPLSLAPKIWEDPILDPKIFFSAPRPQKEKKTLVWLYVVGNNLKSSGQQYILVISRQKKRLHSSFVQENSRRFAPKKRGFFIVLKFAH